MKRKIVYAGAAWGAGLLSASLLLPAFYLPLIIFSGILLLAGKFLLKFHFREYILILVSFSVAVGYYGLYSHFKYDKVIEYAGQEILFEGKVKEITEYSGEKSRYILKGKINGKDTVEISVYTDAYNCDINDYFTFTGTLKLPDNTYLFNSLDYNKSKGIYLESDEISSVSVKSNGNISLGKILKNYRNSVKEFINASLPKNEASMLTGMLFGDKSGMQADDKTMFYHTGIGHVMAVSGLHLVLFCGIFSAVFKRLKLNKRLGFLLLEVLIILFSVCSGLSPSVLRAALMITLVFAAPLFFRYADTLNSICIALIILTVSNPFSIRNPSLVLSVSGTFSAGVLGPYLSDKITGNGFIKRNIRKAAYMFVVSAGVFPVSVIFFGEGSFFSPLANIVLTPLCMAALFFGMIASLLLFIHPVFLLKVSGILCRVVLNSVRIIGSSEFSYMNFNHRVKLLSAILIVFCALSYFIFRNYKAEIVALVTSWVIFCVSVTADNYINSSDIRIALLGKNSIDVVIIVKNNNADVIDLNGKRGNCKYAVKYLEENNVRSVNSILLTAGTYNQLSLYNDKMNLFEVDNLFVRYDMIIRSDCLICGVIPEYTNYSDLSLGYSDYGISVNDSMIAMNYGEFSFVCDSQKNTDKATVFAEYENLFEPPECSALIIPEYNNEVDFGGISDTNVEITAGKNGGFSIRRL